MRAQPAPERQSISHYDLLEKVGEGGMGAVFRAHDRKLDRTVALKFLRGDFPSAPEKQRFLQEARAVSRLSHRNIAAIHSIEEFEGETFLVFEYLPGGTLRSLLESLRARGAALDPRQIAGYGLEIAEALAHAHANGIIHRDLKPGNLMFARDGSLKLVDFGVSKLRGNETQTPRGALLGTPLYMSPEQAQGRGADERSDVFSLGVVLYEMAAGQPPFHADHCEAVVHQIIHDAAPPIESTACPARLAAIIGQALEKNPSARYQRMVEIADDLRAFLRGASPIADLPTRTIEAWRPVSRRRALLAIALLVAAIAAFLLTPLRDRLGTRLPADERVAILPFENVGGDPANQAFCDGLLESAIATLRQIEPRLVVTPAAEVRRLAIQNADVARKLAGANLVIRGKVRRTGTQVQVDLELVTPLVTPSVTPSGPGPLDSAHVTHDAGAPRSIQENMAAALAKLLRLKMPDRRVDAVSRVPAANEAYLEGVGYTQRYDIPGSTSKAVQALERAVQTDPNFTAAYIALGNAYQLRYREGKDQQFLDHARENAARALDLDGASAGAHTVSGVVLSLGGDQEGAITEFRRALSLDPLNGDTLRELATAYGAAGRISDAEAAYRKAAELRPRDPMTLAQMAQFDYNHQHYVEAEKGFRAAIALVPDSPTHHRNLGGVYIAMGRFDDAERELLKSIGLGATSSAYSNLGALYIYEVRYADAIGALQQAIQLSPGGIARSYTLWGNLGDAYRYTPDEASKAPDAYRHAIEQIEQQLAFGPDNAVLLSSEAEYAAKIGERARALDAIGRAMRFSQGDKKVSFRAALVYELTGSRDRALAALRDAIRGGYSLDEIEREPDLAKLRQDGRYKQIVTAESRNGRK